MKIDNVVKYLANNIENLYWVVLVRTKNPVETRVFFAPISNSSLN